MDSERRAAPRYQFIAEAEVTEIESDSKLTAKTGDLGISGQLDFRGKLRLDAKLSQTTTGMKSFFLKAVDPFFKGKDGGTVLPIKITGTKDQPKYGLDLHDKANKEPAPAPAPLK